MTTYYIDPSAGVNGTGTLLSPYNVWPASSTLVAGDSLLFKRGTTLTINAINSSFIEGGNAYRYIAVSNVTVGDYGDGLKPVITINSYYNANVSPGPTQLIRVADAANNFTFKNIECRNCQIGTIFNIGGGDNYGLLIDGVEVYDNIHMWVDNISLNASLAGCIGFGGNSTLKTATIKNVIIDGCNSDGIWAKVSDKFEVSYTTIKNVNANPSADFFTGDCIQLTGPCIEYRVHHCTLDHSNFDAKQTIIQSTGTSGRTYIHDNILIGYLESSGSHFGAVVYSDQPLTMYRNIVTSAWQAVTTASSGNRIYSNIFYCYKRKTNTQQISFSFSGDSDSVVSNNIFKKLDSVSDYTDRAGVVGTINSSSNIRVFNNIFDGNFTYATQVAGIASNLVYNNVFTGGVVNPCSRWYSPYSYFASESVNGINTNPLLNLTNPLAPKISAASPCKYAGKFSGYLTDFRGRPFNNPPTIGPFEFTSRSKRY